MFLLGTLIGNEISMFGRPRFAVSSSHMGLTRMHQRIEGLHFLVFSIRIYSERRPRATYEATKYAQRVYVYIQPRFKKKKRRERCLREEHKLISLDRRVHFPVISAKKKLKADNKDATKGLISYHEL